MALFEDTLRAHLAGYAGLSALVGTRITAERSFQDATLPLLVYEQTGETREQSLDTVVRSHLPRYRFTAHAATYEAAKAIVVQVEAAIGTFTAGSGFTLHDRLLGDSGDDYDFETKTYSAWLEAELLYTG